VYYKTSINRTSEKEKTVHRLPVVPRILHLFPQENDTFLLKVSQRLNSKYLHDKGTLDGHCMTCIIILSLVLGNTF